MKIFQLHIDAMPENDRHNTTHKTLRVVIAIIHAVQLELVTISDDISLTIGESVLLTCVGYGQPYILITWERNGERLMNDTNVIISEQNFTQGGRLLRQSALSLCNLEISDAGNYTCTVSNGQASITASSTIFGKCNYLHVV